MVRLDRFTAYLLHAVNNPISTEVFGARGLSSVMASGIKPKAITLLKEELHSFDLCPTAITDADPPTIKCTTKTDG